MKNVCRIVGAADFDPSQLQPSAPGDMLIAADGGLRSLRLAGIEPDVSIGDYDSLGCRPVNIRCIELPVEKDDTDMAAAAKLGLEKGYVNFEFYGVLGGRRFSHSLAAVQTLLWLRDNGGRGVIISPDCRVELLQDEIRCFDEESNGFISVFAMDEACVTLEGLKYPLNEYPLSPRFPLGVSNEFIGKTSRVIVNGTAVLVLEKK